MKERAVSFETGLGLTDLVQSVNLFLQETKGTAVSISYESNRGSRMHRAVLLYRPDTDEDCED